MSDLILHERFERVLKLTLNRPERRNPLSNAMSAEICAQLGAAESDPEVGAVIITGAGETFCAGGDQTEFRAALGKPASELLEGYTPLDVFKLANSYKKPLIAAVGGPAMGGGFGITCLSHIAVAADTATFGIPEIRLGVFPLTILPLIRPVIGDRWTLDLALTGRTITAAEAQEIGLVNRVVPAAELQQAALEVATLVAGYSPLVLKLGLTAFYETTDMEFHKAMEYLNTIRTVLFGTEDLNEGSAAFLEKRKPRWKGR